MVVSVGDFGDNDGDVTVAAPGSAKNVLTVGAAETAAAPDTVASFSGRGPTLDLRIKPDVVAPGDPVWSAVASGQYGLATCKVGRKSGTGMAAPAAAGAAALLRQFLVKGKHAEFSPRGFNASEYDPAAPSGALLKCLLVASAEKVSAGGAWCFVAGSPFSLFLPRARHAPPSPRARPPNSGSPTPPPTHARVRSEDVRVHERRGPNAGGP